MVERAELKNPIIETTLKGRRVIEVYLSSTELRLANTAGTDRFIAYVEDKERRGQPVVPYRGGGPDPKRGVQNNFIGGCCESAVAKWRNHYWSGRLGEYFKPDVGELQVRGNSEKWGDLTLHNEDLDHEKFILVLADRLPRFTIFGWLFAKEGKHKHWWRTATRGKNPYDKSFAYWVRQSMTRKMETLSTTEYSPKLAALPDPMWRGPVDAAPEYLDYPEHREYRDYPDYPEDAEDLWSQCYKHGRFQGYECPHCEAEEKEELEF
jgi:hypothetical protein